MMSILSWLERSKGVERFTAEDVGLIQEWYEFRDNCYRSRAEDWCRAHDLDWE